MQRGKEGGDEEEDVKTDNETEVTDEGQDETDTIDEAHEESDVAIEAHENTTKFSAEESLEVGLMVSEGQEGRAETEVPKAKAKAATGNVYDDEKSMMVLEEEDWGMILEEEHLAWRDEVEAIPDQDPYAAKAGWLAAVFCACAPSDGF